MTQYTSHLTEAQQVDIVSNFILHAPPGEFNEVFNDVRCLLNNDNLLKQGASKAFVQHNKEQLVQVSLKGVDQPCLITNYNDLGGSRFFDPRSKNTFRYDHLKKEASEIRPLTEQLPANVEAYRSALDDKLYTYTCNHYKTGACAVFASGGAGGGIALTACIEDHQFQPKNFWNGRWRSQWTVTVQSGGTVDLIGLLKVQVHYYEDGNVQLVSSKEVKGSVSGSGEAQTAKEVISFIEKAENEYQSAIGDNYQTMSDATFKALRRQLPVTRSKIDWGKIIQYTIGKELKH
nr:CAPZA [Parasacculina yatsui]